MLMFTSYFLVVSRFFFEPIKMKYLLVFVSILAVAKGDLGILKEYTEGNSKFSVNIYKELMKTNSGNFLVCPMSVETIFALIHAGAKGQTASQILTGFNFPSEVGKVQSIFKELSPKLQHTGVYNLSSANKIYIGEGFEIKDDFKNVAVNTYDAAVQEIDFKKKDAAVKEINDWVEEKTFNKIQNLLSSDDINESTIMILVNAMFFKANWFYEFDKDNTKKRNFYLDAKNTVDVDTMEITKRFEYHECQETNAKYLEMTFYGSDVTMTIVLPNAKDGLAHLEEQLEKVVEKPKYTMEKVHVRLPKFEMGSKIEFQPILSKLGVVNAFTGKADFSNISDAPMQISKVLQKTFIKVEETGTTAAAATAVSFVLTSLQIGPPPQPPKEFFADHPFIYILRNPHGVMFIGRYVSNVN